MWVSMTWRNRITEAGLDIARSHAAVNDRAGAFKVGWLADVSRLPSVQKGAACTQSQFYYGTSDFNLKPTIPARAPPPPAAPLAHAGKAAAPLANSKPRPLTKVMVLNLNVLTDTPPPGRISRW
jgi:hypothetical protein